MMIPFEIFHQKHHCKKLIKIYISLILTFIYKSTGVHTWQTARDARVQDMLDKVQKLCYREWKTHPNTKFNKYKKKVFKNNWTSLFVDSFFVHFELLDDCIVQLLWNHSYDNFISWWFRFGMMTIRINFFNILSFRVVGTKIRVFWSKKDIFNKPICDLRNWLIT